MNCCTASSRAASANECLSLNSMNKMEGRAEFTPTSFVGVTSIGSSIMFVAISYN